MKKVDIVTLDVEEFPAVVSNILSQCKTTYPKSDPIHKLDVKDFGLVVVSFFKKGNKI